MYICMTHLMKMAPNHHPHHFMLQGLPLEPVSRTYQYRKIMKPMLERKRRARINKCLDELKDLMTNTLQADGENLSKLEKADILELTVRHLHRLRETNHLFVRHTDSLNMENFWAGFQHCALEVSHFLQKYDQQNKHINGDLIKYIANHIPSMAGVVAAAAANRTTNNTPTSSTATTHIPQFALSMQTSSSTVNFVANMSNNIGNENYQRLSTALCDLPHNEARVINISPATTTNRPTATLVAATNVQQQNQKNQQQQHQQMQISTSAVSNFERIWEAAARAAAAREAKRIHPYMRKVVLHNHCNGSGSGVVVEVGSGDESSCGYGCGNFGSGGYEDGSSKGNVLANGELIASDDIVWRPW